MAAVTYIVIKHDDAVTFQGVVEKFADATDKRIFADKLCNFILKTASGSEPSAIQVHTFDSTTPGFGVGNIEVVNANVTAGDTVTVGGVEFEAVAAGAGNLQFNIGGTSDITATNLAAAINTDLDALVTANADGADVEIEADVFGPLGGLVSLATSDATAFLLTQLSGGGSVDDFELAEHEFGEAL